jgi:hypothetical protein
LDLNEIVKFITHEAGDTKKNGQGEKADCLQATRRAIH